MSRHNWQRPLPDDKPAWQAILEAHSRALVNLSKQMDEDRKHMRDGIAGHAADLLLQAMDDISDITNSIDSGVEWLAHKAGE